MLHITTEYIVIDRDLFSACNLEDLFLLYIHINELGHNKLHKISVTECMMQQIFNLKNEFIYNTYSDSPD